MIQLLSPQTRGYSYQEVNNGGLPATLPYRTCCFRTLTLRVPKPGGRNIVRKLFWLGIYAHSSSCWSRNTCYIRIIITRLSVSQLEPRTSAEQQPHHHVALSQRWAIVGSRDYDACLTKSQSGVDWLCLTLDLRCTSTVAATTSISSELWTTGHGAHLTKFFERVAAPSSNLSRGLPFPSSKRTSCALDDGGENTSGKYIAKPRILVTKTNEGVISRPHTQPLRMECSAGQTNVSR